jgi:hypothetical protein
MSDDAARFRKHAFECRRLARGAQEAADRQMLTEIAEDLEAEAENIERAGAAKPDDV